MAKPAGLLHTFDEFLAEIAAGKGEKRAGEGLGETSHPSADVPNGTQAATTGERAAENERDVKETVVGPSVDETPEAKPSSGDSFTAPFQSGPVPSGTGEDSGTEDDYKANKDDSGTKHPAQAGDGEKYSAMSFVECAAGSKRLADQILAGIAVKGAQARKDAPAAPAKAEPVKAAEQTPAQKAAAAGYAASALLGQDPRAMAMVTLEDTIKEARANADLTAEYLRELGEELRKQAEGEDAPPPEDPAAAGPPAGGAPDIAAIAGEAPTDGAGPPMGGDAGGSAGGAPSQEEAMSELSSALMEMGITPDELLQLADALRSQAQGGGGAPAPAMKEASEWEKAARAVKAYRRTGKYAFGAPKTAKADAMRRSFREHIGELAAKV